MKPSTKPEVPGWEMARSERPDLEPAGARYVALDAFRGIAIAAMILVNTPGGSAHRFAPLRHSVWNGCTPADAIFPAFLFIVGVAIWLSVGEAVVRGAKPGQLLGKVVRRSLLIFALGLVLNAFPEFEWSHLRIPGILQRIALCYLLASLVVLTAGIRGAVVAAVSLLVGETLLLALVQVPGAPEPWQTPAGNVGALIDHALLPGHLLHEAWDPEGLLGTLSATATTLAGVLTGRFWARTRGPEQRVAVMFAAGALGVVVGLALSSWVPINKSLWTVSFATFTVGTSLLILAVCSWLIDVHGLQAWAQPFVVYGSNPLLAYVLSVLSDKALRTYMVAWPDGSRDTIHTLVYRTMFLRVFSGAHASLAYSIAFVLVWLVPLGLLYRYRIFVKI